MKLWEVENITLEPMHAQNEAQWLPVETARQLSVDPAVIASVEPLRRSIDARKKGRPLFRYTLAVHTHESCTFTPLPQVKIAPRQIAHPQALMKVKPSKQGERVVIIGAGPAGLFAAHRLAAAGLRPIVIERGKAVEPRSQDVQRLKRYRVLNEESNFCFGEGGAGTWSDGKLTTRIGDPLVSHVFHTIVGFGGPPEILVDGKPHLGTNRLIKLLRQMRADLLANGGEILFETRIVDLVTRGGAVVGVKTHAGDVIDCDHLILAPGHSARDVFHWAARAGVALESKPFAVGFRVEHPQALIDEIQYGRGAHLAYMPAADYRLTHNTTVQGKARGVYSFCMCPGGVIVPTATEADGLCINGMSHASRSSPYANSALVVTVDPGDFKSTALFAGVEFQKEAERRAFVRGQSSFKAPAQRLTDLLARRPSSDLVKTSYLPGVESTSLDGIYPDFVMTALREAVGRFERTMPGYLTREAYLLGVETRTSSPIRMPRGADLQSVSMKRLYPVGEGAGYAGGIVSAAVDGVRAADAILAGLI